MRKYSLDSKIIWSSGYIHCHHYTNIWYSTKIHFLLSHIAKKWKNMKKKIIDYLIDYACPIISDNRLWNFSDCTSLPNFYKRQWLPVHSLCIFSLAAKSTQGKAKKNIMFVSCYSTDPVWNPPTQNFLLTQGEKKRGKRIFDSCELIQNQIDNFRTCLSLSCRVNISKFNV